MFSLYSPSVIQLSSEGDEWDHSFPAEDHLISARGSPSVVLTEN